MTEFLLRVHDRINTRDNFMTQRLTKRGDFISILPDGWTWGSGEITAPFWRIIASDIPEEEALGWLAEEPYTEGVAQIDIVWKRKVMWFRVDRAVGDFAVWLADDTRPSGNVPDRRVSGQRDEGGVMVSYGHRVPMWYLRAEEIRAFVERKPSGPSRPMVAGDGFVVREVR